MGQDLVRDSQANVPERPSPRAMGRTVVTRTAAKCAKAEDAKQRAKATAAQKAQPGPSGHTTFGHRLRAPPTGIAYWQTLNRCDRRHTRSTTEISAARATGYWRLVCKGCGIKHACQAAQQQGRVRLANTNTAKGRGGPKPLQ